MSLDAEIRQRSNDSCELCGAQHPLAPFALPDSDGHDGRLALCDDCLHQIATPDNAQHLRCLTNSIWSPVPAVQVLSYRLLSLLSTESWAQEQLDMAYLDDDLLAWAKAGIISVDADAIVHKDCHGAVLQAGDTVTIIKDLDVKGTSFVAKRGTAVRGISLTDNPAHIEGRVNGTRIVILTEYVKKS